MTVLCSFGYVALTSWPPAHIENWKTGADAERRTEKTLRVLESEGWDAVHDLASPFGNIDHVIVGPGGVFLLDTKQMLGQVAVDGDTVRVSRRRESPRRIYQLECSERRARRGAGPQPPDRRCHGPASVGARRHRPVESV